MASSLLVLTASLFAASPVTAQTYEELQSENVQLRSQLNGTLAQVAHLSTQNTALAGQLSSSLTQNQQLSVQVSNLSSQLSQQSAQVAALNARIAELQNANNSTQLQSLIAQNTALAAQLNSSLAQNAFLKSELLALQPPVPHITAPASVPCIGGRGVAAVHGLGSFDPSGGPIQFHWLGRPPTPGNHGPVVDLSLAPGLNEVALLVSKPRVSNVTTARIVVTDDVAPVSTARLTGTIAQDGWFSAPVQVDVQASDACGVAQVLMALDGDVPRRTESLLVVGDGAHTVTYQATDLSGRVEPLRNVTVRIDSGAPLVELQTPAEATLVVGGEAAPLPAATAPVVVGDVTVEAAASDAVSGVQRVEFWVDDILRGTDHTSPYTFAWPSGAERAGVHVLDVLAYDGAGNLARDSRAVLTVATTPGGAFASLGTPCDGVLAPGLCSALPAPLAPQEACSRVVAPAVCGTVFDSLGECERVVAEALCRALLLTKEDAVPAAAPATLAVRKPPLV